MAKSMGSSYQLLGHWQNHVSSKQAMVDTCRLVKDNGGVLSKEEGSGTVLPKLSKKASRSDRL